MTTTLKQVQELKVGNYIYYNKESFLIEKIKPNKNNKNFVFIHTTCNYRVELPKQLYIQQIAC